MKKFLALTLLVLTLAVCALTSACGGVTGTFKFDSMKVIRENHLVVELKRGQEYDGVKFDADSMVMTVTESGEKDSPIRELTFTAPYIKDAVLTGEWEFVKIDGYADNEVAVLNVRNDGPEIILAEYRNGVVTVVVYKADVDYIITLKK